MDDNTTAKVFRNSKRPLIADIPETSPAMTERQRGELIMRIWRGMKRQIFGTWPKAD